MQKLQTLWLDLNASLRGHEIPSEFKAHCEFLYCSDIDDLEAAIYNQPIDVVCFDFDYPDRRGLRLLRETKLANAWLPVIMLTLQHSESLAIWSYRAGVWDYLVKPVPKREVERCLLTLSRAMAMRKSQPPRTLTVRSSKIPDEVSFTPKSLDGTLAPAIYYVEKHFRSKVRNEDVAKLCGMSPFRFSRAFKDTFGITFRDYLGAYRVKEACRLLENPAVSVTDVAFAVGFNDASYFSRVFRQRIGVAPSMLVGHCLEDLGYSQEALPNLPHYS